MNMFLRTMWVLLRARRGSRLSINDVGRIRMRVLPNDMDVLNHMNNGVYLSVMDLGRFDLLVRSGVWAEFQKRGYYPVVTNQTISYRRSLQPWQRYTIETRIAGYDDRSVYVEQRFVVKGEIHAHGFIRGRFLKRSGGIVTMEELADAAGIDTSEHPVPEWLASWAADVALPPSKASHVSDWA